MGIMTIDGRHVEFGNEKNVLEVIRAAGIDIPTLCYHSELSIYGACRLCTVEDARGKTFTSCSEKPRDGMEILTNTPRLVRYRRMILELLLSAHDRDCTSCRTSGRCVLQQLAKRMGVGRVRFENTREFRELDKSSPSIVRDPNKCILCGDCVRMCADVQHVNAIDFAHRGVDAVVSPAFNKNLSETECVGCGQCSVVCPTAALVVKSDVDAVRELLADRNTRVVVQVAPAVRVALGDAFGMPLGKNVMGRLVGVLHRLGFAEVYDTAYGADLTVIEEAREFMNRFGEGRNLPLFTSCCPAWVKFCETRYPDLAGHLSTCRSPMAMFGAVVREHYRNPENGQGKKLVSVAIMPCTAKKEEILRPESSTRGVQDVDYVLTTAEAIDLIRNAGILFDQVEIESPDVPFGIGSGSAMIFGVSGGVTEAVLRRLQDGHDRESMGVLKKCGVRGSEGIREFVFEHYGKPIRAAVVSGLGNADKVLQRIRAGESQYELVEFMACPGGCIMGGGQPARYHDERARQARQKGLYDTDVTTQIKRSNENPLVQSLYEGLLKGKEHLLLHRNFEAAGKAHE